MKANTILLMSAAIVSAAAACGQELAPTGKSRLIAPTKPTKVLSPEEVEKNKEKANAFRKSIAERGGWVSVPMGGPTLKLIDATSKGWALEGLEAVKVNLDRFGLCPSEVKKTGVPSSVLGEGRAAVKGSSCVVMLVDGAEDAPVMTVYPEEHLAFVNMTVLCQGANNSGIRQDRVEKLTWRAIGHLAGCGAPDGYTCVMQPIRDMAALDAMPNKFIHPATFFKARPYFDLRGVTPARKGTYESAVRQGWAPAPTNDIQKAIWNKVHAPPANPMKIEFDPKKGR